MTSEWRKIVSVVLVVVAALLALLAMRRPRSTKTRPAPVDPPTKTPKPGAPTNDYDKFAKLVKTISSMPRQDSPEVDEAILALRAVDLPGTGRGCFVEVVGESFRLDALRRSMTEDDGSQDATFHLFPEVGNQFDENAIAVLTDQRVIVGYLTREDAPRYRQTLFELRARGEIGRCSGRFVGGTTEKPNIGVWLDLIPPTRLAKHFGVAYEPVRD